MKRTKKKHKLNYIYQGMTLIGRQGRLCRIVLKQGYRFLIEFEDRRRDFAFLNELEKIEDPQEIMLNKKLPCIQTTMSF